MKTTFAFFVAVSLLLGSVPRVTAGVQGDRYDRASDLSAVLQNRDCKGDKDDNCQ